MVLSSRKRALMALAIAGAYLLIAVANGIDWVSREPWKAHYVFVWEAVYNGSACITNIALCLAYSEIRYRLHGAWHVLCAASLCFIGGAIWVSIAHFAIALTMPVSFNFWLGWQSILFQGGLASGTTLFLVSSVYFGIENWKQAVEQKESARQAIALAHQAQLQMLRYQLNPHFLFNALNSIRGMIVEDQHRSRAMITNLAEFLRYSLGSDGQGTSIADEIQAIENYLDIQRIRFEDHLDASMHVDSSALRVEIPSFLIHPLVENAVKYGMKTSTMPLRVRVDVTKLGDELRINVANSGRMVDAVKDHMSSEGTGIGLKNICERLKLLFPGQYSFDIGERDGWVHAEVRLKLSERMWAHETA